MYPYSKILPNMTTDNPMYKNQQHIDMLKQLYNNLVVALKMAVLEAIPNSTLHKHHILGWNKDVGEKYEVAGHAYLYWWTIINPKVHLYYCLLILGGQSSTQKCTSIYCVKER